MYYLYVLISESDNKLYIGFTPDLKSRLTKHNLGYVLATKNRRPLKLIYYESYLNPTDARKREIYLKGGKGHEELKTQLSHSFKQVGYKFRL
ncbi:MAG: GIY-YIG nuclease family protein [Patescibacteria group bacterium]